MNDIFPNTWFSACITSSEEQVRNLLRKIRDWMEARGDPEEACGNAELVLAEALNNIVEHAYSDSKEGMIEIQIEPIGSHLNIIVSDSGAALPGLQLPEPHLPAPYCSIEDLPEGGFGWYLIHKLTSGLNYERTRNSNRLNLKISTKLSANR